MVILDLIMFGGENKREKDWKKKMAGKRQKEFDQNKAMELYKKGLGWREIARELGDDIHPFSIQFFFKSLGLPPNQKVGGNKRWDVKEAIKLKEEGYSVVQIAEMLGMSTNSIYRGISEFRREQSESALSEKL